MKRSIFSLSLALAIAVVPSAAHAVNFFCGPNTIDYLGLDAGGNVYTTVKDAGVTVICNMNGSTGGATAEACRAWYGSLLTNRSRGKMVTFAFSSDTPNVGGLTSCAAFGAWTTRSPYFLQLEN
jgi:hypothetical protein